MIPMYVQRPLWVCMIDVRELELDRSLRFTFAVSFPRLSSSYNSTASCYSGTLHDASFSRA